MSFEEVKNMNNARAEEHINPEMEIYDEDGDLNPDFAAKVFCEMGREELLEIDPGILADVILDSRRVLTKATEVEYVTTTLLSACLTGFLHGELTYIEMFKRLTENGTCNMTPEELTELLHGFVFAKSDEINVLMSLGKMMLVR